MAPRAWGWNPSSRAIFAAADPRQWGFPVVTLPAPAVVAGAAAGEEAGAGAAAVAVTVCVDLGKEGAKGAPTRSLYVGVEGQPLQRVVLPLPRDVRLWVQLLPGCGGVEVQRYERFGSAILARLPRVSNVPVDAPPDAAALGRWKELQAERTREEPR